MSITERGKTWEWMQSWYILLTLGFGMTHFLAFIYTGLRVRKWLWVIFGLVYLGLIVYFVLEADKTQKGEPMAGTTILIWFVPTFIAFIHAFIIRKEFLMLLDARGKAQRVEDDRLRTRIQANYGVSGIQLDANLVEFKESDATVRIASALFSVFPFSPQYEYYFNLNGALRRVARRDDPVLLEKAKRIANSEEVMRALKVASVIDKADGGLGIYTGIKNAYDAATNKDRKRTFEADPQQAADAALKAIALSYMIAILYPGGVTDKMKSFLDTPAGQEIALFYAGVEIALPFMDNLIENSGEWMAKLFASSSGQDSRFSEFAGSIPFDQAKVILENLKNYVDSTLTKVKPYLDPLKDKVMSIAPTALNIADSTTGAIATGLDLLPFWKFLGARLAAEASVYRAMKET